MLIGQNHNQSGPRALSGSAWKRAMLAAALVVGTGPAALAQFGPPPEAPSPFALTVTSATVSFPLGTIPVDVNRSAVGTVSSDGTLANLTGGIGPLTSDTYSVSAPAGIQFRLEGGINGTVPAGTPVQYVWEVIVQFDGGGINWSLSGNNSVPGAGLHNVAQNGQLQPGTRTISYTANRVFAGTGTGNGFYNLQLSLNWNSLVTGQTLQITVNRMQIALPAAGPTALAAVGAGLAGLRRRRS